MMIGELASATATKVETVRYYEKIGLLPPPARTSANYRSYGNAHLGRLSFIRRARNLGFGLDAVRELLRLADEPDRPCSQIDNIASVKIAEIDSKIADLKRLRKELYELVSACETDTVGSCRVVEALAPRGSHHLSD
ncbi:MAG: MerR family transcriptional regulator [Sphingomonadaceae bacterium]|nr:MerR family transcriptional regulator [Sphingomonadaceae bacterium]